MAAPSWSGHGISVPDAESPSVLQLVNALVLGCYTGTMLRSELSAQQGRKECSPKLADLLLGSPSSPLITSCAGL